MSRWLDAMTIGVALVAPAVQGADPAFADRSLALWIADLSEKDPLIREEAIEVLIKIGAEARVALPKLAEIQEKDASPEVRRRAAVALWRLDGQAKPARDLLSAELKAPLPGARLRAAGLLRELGMPSRDLAPVALDSLHDPDPVVSGLASSLLNQLGDDAVPAVVAVLPKASIAKRQTLVTFLQGLGPSCQPAVSALRDLLKDQDARARLASSRALLAMNPDDAVALAEIQNLLKATDAVIKLETAYAALTLPHKLKALAPFYRSTLQTGDAVSRGRAAEALWELDPKSLKDILPVLISLLRDQTGAAYPAVQTLMRIGRDAKDAIEELVNVVKMNDYRIPPQTVVQALGRMGPDAVDPLLDLLRNPASQARGFVQTALATIGPDGIGKMAPALADRDVFVRRTVFAAIAGFGPAAKQALPQLMEALKESDATLRQLAIRIIGQIGPAADKAVPVLLEIVKNTTQPENTRALAALALAQIGPGARPALDELSKLLKDSSLAVRFRAAEAVLRAGGNRADAIPAMLDLLLLGKSVPGVSVQEALSALLAAEVPPSDVVRALGESLRATAETGFRQQVAIGLQQWPASTAFLPILDFLAKDKDSMVRYHAACALARFGQDRKHAAAALGKVLTEFTALWREPPTLTALIILGPAARELHTRLMDQFRSEFDVSAKVRLAEAAVVIDRDQAGPPLAWLREQLKLGTPAQRAAAAHVLAKVDAKNPSVLNCLLVQANDTNATVAADALADFGLLGESGKPAVVYLRKTMSSRDSLRRVRAALAFWQIEQKADDVVPVLVAALSEKLTPVGIVTQPSNAPPTGRFVAAQAATALGEMGAAAAAALPQLKDARANGDLVVSTAAADAIKKIEGAK